MYDIHVGEQKSLVFPIMCNAYVSIGYEDNIPDIEGTPSDTTDDIPYGLWAHEGDFSFEAIVTPYDINGESVARDRANSEPEKVMPNGVTSGVSQSDFYLDETSATGRLNHEMMIFYNSKFSVSLVNTTTTTINQPAEYKIRVSFLGGVANVETSTVITSSKERIERLDNNNYNTYLDGFNEEGFRVFDNICRVSLVAAASGQKVIRVSHTNNLGGHAYMPVGTELFTRDEFTYTSIGTIASVSSNDLTMSVNLTSTLSALTDLYVETFKEPKYIGNTHHIGVSYLDSAKLVQIFYNGKLMQTSTVPSLPSPFVFDRSDFLLGRATTATTQTQNYAYTAKQFMGEMHEMCIEKTYKSKYVHMHSLLPKFDETLLYLRFEEVDL